jgi:hypothetical protein
MYCAWGECPTCPTLVTVLFEANFSLLNFNCICSFKVSRPLWRVPPFQGVFQGLLCYDFILSCEHNISLVLTAFIAADTWQTQSAWPSPCSAQPRHWTGSTCSCGPAAVKLGRALLLRNSYSVSRIHISDSSDSGGLRDSGFTAVPVETMFRCVCVCSFRLLRTIISLHCSDAGLCPLSEFSLV